MERGTRQDDDNDVYILGSTDGIYSFQSIDNTEVFVLHRSMVKCF